MCDNKKLDEILIRLTAIEDRLSKTVTHEDMTSMATLEDVKEIGAEAAWAAQEIVDAEQRRERLEMLAGARAAMRRVV